MPGFCTSIVLAFILGVKLFDYVVNGWRLQEPGCGSKLNGGYDLKMEENQTLSKPCRKTPFMKERLNKSANCLETSFFLEKKIL